MNLPDLADVWTDGPQWLGWWSLQDVAVLVLASFIAWRISHLVLRRRRGPNRIAPTEGQFQAVLASTLDPMTLVRPVRDPRGLIVDFVIAVVNPAACAWIGGERDTLRGQRLLDVIPEIAATGLLDALAITADTGRPTIIDDFPFPLGDVGTRWMWVRGSRGGDLVCIVWRDVTDKYRAAEKLARSEEQFRLLAENSTDVIVQLDPNDKVLWISPSAAPVLGWKPADCLGRSGVEFLTTTETRERYARDKARVLAGQSTVSRGQIRNAAGETHWVEAHTFPYRTPDGILNGVVASLRLVDAEVRMQQDLDRRARIDDQTGLLNRRELLERLEAVVGRHEAPVGLLWCDIDRFKSINDFHGHAAGDAVLVAIGQRIRDCLRSAADFGGRISGDELIVVLRGIGGLDDAVARAESLRSRVAEPIPAGDDVIRATISIGVTLLRADEGVDVILARADDAMYQAKALGKDRVCAIPAPAGLVAAG